MSVYCNESVVNDLNFVMFFGSQSLQVVFSKVLSHNSSVCVCAFVRLHN